MAKVTINQVRSVEWGKSYNWDLRFTEDQPDSPFDEWFPAIDVEEGIASLETFMVSDAFLSSYEIPMGTSPRTLRITFIDDAKHTLLSWMEEWVNSVVLNKRDHVSTLEKSVRTVMVRRTTGNGETIENKRIGIRSYYVFPKDTISYTGNSSSDLLTYSVTFAIAGVSGEFSG